MDIQQALCIIDAAQRDNLTGSGDLEILQTDLRSDKELRDSICEEMGFSPEELDKFVEAKLGTLRKSEAEFRSKRPPRRFQNGFRP